MTALLPYRPNPPAIRRLCLAVDIESYSTRSIPEQIDLQTRLLWTMLQACRVADVKPARCDRQDSGDGQILILPPSIDESKVLPGLVLGLLTAVRRANEPPGAGGPARLRISLGQGAIQVGATGFASRAVITVARLLDSAELRAALAAVAAADAAVVVTSDLYQDMFSQGYGGLAASGFHEVRIHIPAKRFTADAWIQVPVNPPLLLKVPVFPDMAALARRQQRMRDIGAATAVAWATFVGGQMLLGGAAQEHLPADASASPQLADTQHSPAGHDADLDSLHHDATADDHHAPDYLTHDHPMHDQPGHHGLGHDGQARHHWTDSHGHDGHGHFDSNDFDADSGDQDDSQNLSSLRPYSNEFGPGHDHYHDAHDPGQDGLAHDAAAGHLGLGHDGFADQVLSVDTAYGYDATGYRGSGGYQDPYGQDTGDHHDTWDRDHAWDHHMPGMDGHGGTHA